MSNSLDDISDLPRLMDLKRVCDELKLSAASVKRRIAAGSLQITKDGRRTLVTREDLLEYINRLKERKS